MVDLKAEIDSVDRESLKQRLEEGGVSSRLRKRILEIYEKTKSVVRIKVKYGKRTTKGVRQGCPLSPFLFNILIRDTENAFLVGTMWGKVKVGGEKVKVLEYADDLVILSEEEEGMRWLLNRFEMYCNEKGLEGNTEKTKIIRFRKGENRGSKLK